MRFFGIFAISLLFGCAAAVTPVQPDGTVSVTAGNTLNATNVQNRVDGNQTYMPISVYNNLDSDKVNCYITGVDVNGKVVMLLPNGTFYYPNTTSNTPVPLGADVAIPLGPGGSTTLITLPGYIGSARVWFADGELSFYTVAGYYGASLVMPSAVNPNDPSANVNWGFVEMSYGENIIYVNISYVDFVGLPLGISLYGNMGNQTAPGLNADAVANVCAGLVNQSKIDGQPWSEMCSTNSSGHPLRVLSPQDYISTQSNAFADYWTGYVEAVWEFYTTNNLTLVTSGQYGNVSCNVQSGNLTCEDDNRGYTQPNAVDIFGCNSGPFSLQATDNVVHQRGVPILCAAFDRSTLLLSGGDIQPALNSSYYYTTSPTNYFSKFVHENEASGIGYAFAYDDVTPADDVNMSGTLVDTDPVLLAITVGGPVTKTTAAPSSSSTSSSSISAVPYSVLSSSTFAISSATASSTSSASTSDSASSSPSGSSSARSTSSSSSFSAAFSTSFSTASSSSFTTASGTSFSTATSGSLSTATSSLLSTASSKSSSTSSASTSRTVLSSLSSPAASTSTSTSASSSSVPTSTSTSTIPSSSTLSTSTRSASSSSSSAAGTSTIGPVYTASTSSSTSMFISATFSGVSGISASYSSPSIISSFPFTETGTVLTATSPPASTSVTQTIAPIYISASIISNSDAATTPTPTPSTTGAGTTTTPVTYPASYGASSVSSINTSTYPSISFLGGGSILSAEAPASAMSQLGVTSTTLPLPISTVVVRVKGCKNQQVSGMGMGTMTSAAI